MTTKTPDSNDLNALAMEACDMWQEHLSNLSKNPEARAELTRFLEPQRRLFADWTQMMKQGAAAGSEQGREETPVDDDPTAGADPVASAEGGTPSGDDPLRIAQLALRLAELEKRVAQLEKCGMGAPSDS